MHIVYQKLKITLLRILVLFILYQITRFLFFLYNHSYFSNDPFYDLFRAFIWGTRFDAWVILLFNLPEIIWALIPIKKNLNNFFKFYYIIINSILLLFNLIDIRYFEFTLKRSTADLFNLIGTGNDVWILLPQFIIDFWYIVLFFILIIFILYQTHRFIKYPSISIKPHLTLPNIFLLCIIWIFVFGSIFTILRGTRLRPVSIISASLYANTNDVPLVLNTPFSIIKTYGKTIPNIHKYFDVPEKYFQPIYIIPTNNNAFKNYNVVLIILESFSKEHIGYFSPKNKGFTPFLDSLLHQSMVISNSYANGRKSLESLPSILTSLPSLMDVPYILSPFSSNQIKSLPLVLNKNGYYTSFYHGGTNGTMGFDVFSSMSGIKNYFGRWQYPNPNDYDGNWGIWDEPYLQYVKTQFDHQPTPFFSVIYTLSSHHPYKVPDKYINTLPKGEHEILQSIAYADLSLKKFFNAASKTQWYQHTIFIITADHVFGSHSDFYFNKVGSYSVPIAFFIPSHPNFKGSINTTAQHADLFPSTLYLLGIKDTIFSFGKCIWDTTAPHFAVNYINGEYQLINSDYLLLFNGNKTNGFYRFSNDSLLKNNLLYKDSTQTQKKMEDMLKAIIQIYDYAIINNRLIPKSK